MRRVVILGLVAMLFLPSIGWSKIGGGDIVFHPSGVSNVTYSHDFHVGKLGLKCAECHFKIYLMSVQANKTATMSDMQIGRSCGACHNGKRAFSVKVSCEKCHP